MSRPRSPIALLIALSLAAGLFAASSLGITAPSQAQETTCPAGTVLSNDGAACLSEAVDDNVVTTTSCTVGVLSADGQSCIVPRIDTPAPAPATTAGNTTANAPVPAFTG